MITCLSIIHSIKLVRYNKKKIPDRNKGRRSRGKNADCRRVLHDPKDSLYGSATIFIFTRKPSIVYAYKKFFSLTRVYNNANCTTMWIKVCILLFVGDNIIFDTKSTFHSYFIQMEY